MRIADNAARNVQHGVDVETELDALDAGVGFDVRLRRQIGIDAQGDGRTFAKALRDIGQREQFRFALDVKEKDTFHKPLTQLRVRFADTGVNDLFAFAAGRQRAKQLAAAGHVEAGTVFGHQLANGQIRVRLDAVTNQRIDGGKRLLHLTQMVQQRRLAVDVQRRTVVLRQFADGNLLTMQNALAIMKMVHEPNDLP